MRALAIFSPGVWIHEGAHALACVVSGVKVHRVIVQSHAGMVVHDHSTVRGSVLIGLAPLLVGGILSLFLFSEAKQFWEASMEASILSGWLAFAIAFHALPSYQDMANILLAIQQQFAQLWGKNNGFLFKLGKSAIYAGAWIIGMGLVLLAWLANQSILFRLGVAVGLFWIA